MGTEVVSTADIDNEHFKAWHRYWGELVRTEDDCGTTRLYGFETHSDPQRASAEVPGDGGSFGFCVEGEAELVDGGGRLSLAAGQWFTTPAGCELRLTAATRVVFCQLVGWRGLRMVGGPIERLGRLRYIDRCSDTILSCPPTKGDPCLNHLHFPSRIVQTEHWHPSTRAGVVARGAGACETPFGLSSLVAGLVFCIPARGLHRFLSEEDTLDVIAYHPDSDWGPTDGDHPMANRTWVGDGERIDNRIGVHAEAEIARRWQRAVQSA
jgi:hypothetical protein